MIHQKHACKRVKISSFVILGQLAGSRLQESAMTGSILVLTADLLGRVVFAPSEVPVGIVMAFIGAPFFFFLLLRRRKTSC